MLVLLHGTAHTRGHGRVAKSRPRTVGRWRLALPHSFSFQSPHRCYRDQLCRLCRCGGCAARARSRRQHERSPHGAGPVQVSRGEVCAGGDDGGARTRLSLSLPSCVHCGGRAGVLRRVLPYGAQRHDVLRAERAGAQQDGRAHLDASRVSRRLLRGQQLHGVPVSAPNWNPGPSPLSSL